jgi:hypothetical protein
MSAFEVKKYNVNYYFICIHKYFLMRLVIYAKIKYYQYIKINIIYVYIINVYTSLS